MIGSIEVICGPMFSGKTEELIRRMRRAVIGKQRVQAFKPSIDRRYHEANVVTHSAQTFASVAVPGVVALDCSIDDATQVVGIDEAQFFGTPLVPVVERLASRGVRVVIAGLDMDYLGQPFEPMPQLLAIAESVTKLSAVCSRCGGAATRSHRLAGGSERVQVGAAESYEARCRACALAGEVS